MSEDARNRKFMDIQSKQAATWRLWKNWDLVPHDIFSTRYVSPGFVQPLGLQLRKSTAKKLPTTASFLPEIIIKLNDIKSPHLSSGGGSPWIRTQVVILHIVAMEKH